MFHFKGHILLHIAFQKKKPKKSFIEIVDFSIIPTSITDYEINETGNNRVLKFYFCINHKVDEI